MDERPDAREAEKLSRQRRRALERKLSKLTAGASGAALTLGVALAAGTAAEAATFNVSNLNDSGPGSLRQAIADANATAGADVVTFQAGLTGTITLTSGQLKVNDSVDIQGPGAGLLTVDGNQGLREFYLYNDDHLIDVTISGLRLTGGNTGSGAGIYDSGASLTLDHVTITGNNSEGDGGGLWLRGGLSSVVVRDSVISSNSSNGIGGGVYIGDVSGTVLFQRTRIDNNHSFRDAGGVYLERPGQVTFEDSTISGNAADDDGGGIYLYYADADPITIRRTTISGNTAGGSGGGIYLYETFAPVVIENSTITGNVATAGHGGGLFLYRVGSPLAINNSTISGNTAAQSGGGIYLYAGAHNAVTLANTIVADNTTEDLATGEEGAFDVRYSLVENAGSAVLNDNGGNLFGQDPQLGPLQNNGGPTPTRKPAATSPVLNAGDPAFAPPPSTDQRGLARVFGGRVDMGAVELNPGTFQLSTSAVSVNENAGTVTITITRAGGTDGAVSVAYNTVNGTAVAPGDYTAASGIASFADGDAVDQTFQVTIVNDTLDEPNETFNVVLSNPTGGAVLGAVATEAVTILDDDITPPPAVPALGDLGKILLAGLLGGGGLLLLRRRKGLIAPVVAATLTLGGVQAADARLHPAPEKTAGVLRQAELREASAVLRLADGTTLTVPLGVVKIQDLRHHRHRQGGGAVPKLSNLPASQPVVIKIRHNADGSIKRVKLQLFDTPQAAQAAALKRR